MSKAAQIADNEGTHRITPIDIGIIRIIDGVGFGSYCVSWVNQIDGTRYHIWIDGDFKTDDVIYARKKGSFEVIKKHLNYNTSYYGPPSKKRIKKYDQVIAEVLSYIERNRLMERADEILSEKKKIEEENARQYRIASIKQREAEALYDAVVALLSGVPTAKEDARLLLTRMQDSFPKASELR